MQSIVKKPDLYDLLYKDVVEDIQMYLKLLENSHNILEFGAGTGRVTIPLAEMGHNIDAIDIEESMLETLLKRIEASPLLASRIRPKLDNMCTYVSNKLYDAVIIPLTSFNYLLTEEEELMCLKSVFSNLKDEGFAIIELLSERTYDDINLDDNFKFVKNIIVGENNYYKYYRNTSLNIINRKITQKRLFMLYEKGCFIGEENYIWSNRFVTIEDFEKLAFNAGLYIEEIYGNCQLEKYNENSEDVFIKVRKRKYEK